MTEQRLFSDFPDISTTEWYALIEKDLKGADFSKKLLSESGEGFDIRPFYRAEDTVALEYLKHTVGDIPKTQIRNRQRVVINNLDSLLSELEELTKVGVTAIEIEIPEHLPFEHSILTKAVKFADKNNIELHFDTSGNFLDLIELFSKTETTHSIGFDPLGYAVKNGLRFDNFSGISAFFQDLPPLKNNIKVLNINAKYFGNCGVSASEELAYGLAVLSEYLHIAKQANYPISDLLAHIQYVETVGSHFFIEIAKLRATRILFTKVAEAYLSESETPTPLYIHAETAQTNKTAYSVHTNILRTTTEAMSATIGGANSFTALPFDFFASKPSNLSVRVARNTQIILCEEAKLDAQTDPVVGTYYIEKLIDAIAEKAWEKFKSIESQGGFLVALKSGFIHSDIALSAEKQLEKTGLRKKTILGINQHPNPEETADILFSKSETNMKEDFFIKPIPTVRFSEPFENLRHRVEALSQKPKVCLIEFGDAAMSKARASFSKMFFEIAAFDIVTINLSDTLENTLKLLPQYSDFVVFCSSDADYANLMSEHLLTLPKNSKAVIAGNPTERLEYLKSIGVFDFIHVKTNALEKLSYFFELYCSSIRR